MRLIPTALLLSSVVVGQNYFVQPLGYGGLEGNAASNFPFSYLSARVHQADSNQIGTVMGISALAFRRDDLAGPSSSARVIDVTVSMGKCDISTFSETFANNWLGASTAVYPRKPTNLPNISQPPPAAPSPFAVPIVFDVPYFYDGVDSLLWELQVDNGVTGIYRLDFVNAGTNSHGGARIGLGTGCTTAAGVMFLTPTVSASISTLNLSFTVLRAPVSAPLTLLLGLSNPNLSIPGFCTLLHTDAIASASLGTYLGGAHSRTLHFPWSSSLAGWDLYSQVVAPDASQPGFPLALSNGCQATMPLSSGGATATGMRHTYNISSSSAATGAPSETMAIVTRLTY